MRVELATVGRVTEPEFEKILSALRSEPGLEISGAIDDRGEAHFLVTDES